MCAARFNVAINNNNSRVLSNASMWIFIPTSTFAIKYHQSTDAIRNFMRNRKSYSDMQAIIAFATKANRYILHRIPQVNSG